MGCMERLSAIDLRKKQKKLVLCSLPQAAQLLSHQLIFTHQTILNLTSSLLIYKMCFDLEWSIVKWAGTRTGGKDM